MALSILVKKPEIGVAVFNTIRNSRLFKNQKSTTVTKGDKTSTIEIASDITEIATTIGGQSSNVVTRELNGSSLSVPNASSATNLINVLRDGSAISKSISEGLKSQTLALETIAEILASSLANNTELLSSINVTLVALGHELKALREMKEEENYSNLPLKHISLEKVLFQMYGVKPDGETLTDSEGNQIIPEYSKAQKNAESHIATRDENNMDYSGAEELFDDDNSDYNILTEILKNTVNGIDISKIDKG